MSGPQPDGTALVALTVFVPAQAAQLVADYGELPAPLRATSYYRIPSSTAASMPPGGVYVAGVFLRSASSAEVGAREVADMPVAWLSAVITFSAQIAARAERWPARSMRTTGKALV